MNPHLDGEAADLEREGPVQMAAVAFRKGAGPIWKGLVAIFSDTVGRCGRQRACICQDPNYISVYRSKY